MIRKAKVGDKVQLMPAARRGEHTHLIGGRVVSFWPRDAVTGTVTHVWSRTKGRMIDVSPDHPAGVGSKTWRPKDLERIKPAPAGGESAK